MNSVCCRRVILFVAVAIAGCSDGPGLLESALTESEAHDLVASAVFATYDVTSVLPPAPDGSGSPIGAPHAWATDFEAEVRCPGGGKVALAASVIVRGDSFGDGGRAEYRLVQIHDECVVPGESARRIALWGGPRVNATVDVAYDALGGLTWSGTVLGDVDWVNEGRRGQCAIELTISGQGTSSEGLAEVRGGVCGFPVDASFPLR